MRTALITGGSEGIGYELAKCFALDGYHLILTARNEQKLKNAQSKLQQLTSVDIISIDLSVSGSAEKLYKLTENQNVDVLVNNAGIGYTGKAVKMDSAYGEQLVELNCSSLMILSTLFGKKMSLRHEGIILNVSSTGAFQPGPYIASYYASKSFVLSYTRALHEELKKENVRVFCLCPGPVRTEFYEKSGSHPPLAAMSPAYTAEYAYRHLHQKHCVMIPGIGNKLLRVVPSVLRMHGVKIMKHQSAGE